MQGFGRRYQWFVLRKYLVFAGKRRGNYKAANIGPSKDIYGAHACVLMFDIVSHLCCHTGLYIKQYSLGDSFKPRNGAVCEEPLI